MLVSFQQRVGGVLGALLLRGRLAEDPIARWRAGTQNLVVTGEELSGEGPHLDDDYRAGRGWSGLKRIRWPRTFRLDCSVLGQPLGPVKPSSSISWRVYLRPMKQTTECTCAIMACTVAIEGMHRKVYETFHGAGKYPDAWKAAHDWTDQLLRACKRKKIWTEGEGSIVDDVLTKIKDLMGVKTCSIMPKQPVMVLDKWEKHCGDELTPALVAKLLDQGPCAGRLWATPWYPCFDATENDNWVYRGCGRGKENRGKCKRLYPHEKINGSHAVVCFAYRWWENGEMHVRVLDSHDDDGPERWIHVEELDALYTLKVDCILCGGSAEHHHVDAGASGTRSPKQSR